MALGVDTKITSSTFIPSTDGGAGSINGGEKPARIGGDFDVPPARPLDPAAFANAPATQPKYTLDNLSKMDEKQLSALYASAKAPASVAAVTGKHEGRCLAVGSGDTIFAGLRRWFAGSSLFPWGGKNFAVDGTGSTTGHGINRILGSEFYKFDLSIQPSKVDGKPSLVLNYDKPENPWFIRKIHDEVRDVGGVLLGPAMWKTNDGGVKPVLYFALDLADHQG